MTGTVSVLSLSQRRDTPCPWHSDVQRTSALKTTYPSRRFKAAGRGTEGPGRGRSDSEHWHAKESRAHPTETHYESPDCHSGMGCASKYRHVIAGLLTGTAVRSESSFPGPAS